MGTKDKPPKCDNFRDLVKLFDDEASESTRERNRKLGVSAALCFIEAELAAYIKKDELPPSDLIFGEKSLIHRAAQEYGLKPKVLKDYIYHADKRAKLCDNELEAHAARIRKQLARISEKYYRMRETHIERCLSDALKEAGFLEQMDFVREYKVGKYYVDFAFPRSDRKLFIECDGDYWHGNPNFFGDTLDAIQKHNVERDKAKGEYIRKLDGGSWVLLRFWGSEIKGNMDMVIGRIVEVLKEREDNDSQKQFYI